MPPLTLRDARPDDHDWLVDQHRALYAQDFGFTSEFGDSIAEKLAAFLSRDDPAKHLWIAEGETRLGSIALSTKAPGVGFLNFVLLLPEARGRGLSRLLVDHALATARATGFHTVRLETYNVLTTARDLYRSYGFERTEVTPGLSRFGQTFDQEFWELSL